MNTKMQDKAGLSAGNKMKKEYQSWRLWIAAIGIIGMVALMVLTPDNIGLTPLGKKTVAILFCMVAWWISGICSILTTSFLGLALMLLFKVSKINTVFSGFSDPSIVFLVFGFTLATAISKTGLGTRIAYKIMSRTRPKYSSIVLTLVIISTILAAIIPSGSARTVLMCTLGMMVLPIFGQSEEKMSNVGRGIFTLLGLTSFMGSTAYLTGGASIILTIGLLQKFGYSITYLQWLKMALPPILIVSVILAFIIPKLFKPEIAEVNEENFKEFKSKLQSLGPMSKQEKQTAIIISVVVFFWMIGDFIGLNFIAVGVAGAVALMFPFVNIATDADFNKKIAWDAIYFVGVSLSLSTVLSETKVTEFLAIAINPLMASSTLTIFCLKIWLIATVVHFILPSSQPTFATLLPIVMASAKAQQMSVIIPVVVFVLSFTGVVMVYQQAHSAIAYGFKQFNPADFYKPGLILLFLWLIMTPVVVLYLSALGF